jgi:hypothetical protein
MYKELIRELKKVKTEKDVTVELTELLTDMAIATNMINNQNEHGTEDSKELFNISRMVILNHFDNYLLSMVSEQNVDG